MSLWEKANLPTRDDLIICKYFVNFLKNFPQSREALLEGGDFLVPLMTGTCKEEGILNVSHIIKEPIRYSC